MSWTHSYPLPELPLGAILQDCADIHDVPLEDITVLKIEEGNGTHVCDDKCRDECWSHFDNSDWIVWLCYDLNRGWQAIYGVYQGKPDLWQN